MSYLDDVKANLDAAAASVATALAIFDANQPIWPVWDRTGVIGSPTYSNGDRAVAANGSTAHILRATIGLAPAKLQADIYIDAAGSTGYAAVGVLAAGQSISSPPTDIPTVPSGAYLYRSDAQKINNGSGSSYGSSYTGGDTVNIYLDENGNLWFGKNGTPFGDPVAGTGAAFTGLSGELSLCVAFFGGAQNGPKVTLQHSVGSSLSGFQPWYALP